MLVAGVLRARFIAYLRALHEWERCCACPASCPRCSRCGHAPNACAWPKLGPALPARAFGTYTPWELGLAFLGAPTRSRPSAATSRYGGPRCRLKRRSSTAVATAGGADVLGGGRRLAARSAARHRPAAMAMAMVPQRPVMIAAVSAWSRRRRRPPERHRRPAAARDRRRFARRRDARARGGADEEVFEADPTALLVVLRRGCPSPSSPQPPRAAADDAASADANTYVWGIEVCATGSNQTSDAGRPHGASASSDRRQQDCSLVVGRCAEQSRVAIRSHHLAIHHHDPVDSASSTARSWEMNT